MSQLKKDYPIQALARTTGQSLLKNVWLAHLAEQCVAIVYFSSACLNEMHMMAIADQGYLASWVASSDMCSLQEAATFHF